MLTGLNKGHEFEHADTTIPSMLWLLLIQILKCISANVNNAHVKIYTGEVLVCFEVFVLVFKHYDDISIWYEPKIGANKYPHDSLI